MTTAGDVKEISWDGGTHAVLGGSEADINFGIDEVELVVVGNGQHYEKKKVVPWMIKGLEIEVDAVGGDIQDMKRRIKEGYKTIVITLVSGARFKGQGTFLGPFEYKTGNSSVTGDFGGKGELTAS